MEYKKNSISTISLEQNKYHTISQKNKNLLRCEERKNYRPQTCFPSICWT